MNPFLAFMNFGPWEIFIIFLVIVLLFGARKLPELARSLGKSLGEFKKAKKDFDKELEDASKEPPSNQSNEKAEDSPPQPPQG